MRDSIRVAGPRSLVILSTRALDRVRDAVALDKRSLALFRVLLGCIIIGDLVNRCGDLTAHYTDEGIAPRAMLVREGIYNHAWFSLHMASGSFVWELALFVVHTAVAAMLVVGYHTTWAVVLSWVLCCSLQARNTLILHGGDTLMRMMLFFSMFLPLGERFSLDAAMAASGTPKTAAKRSELRGGRGDETELPIPVSTGTEHRITSDAWRNAVSNVCSFAFIAQLCIMYAFNFVHKDGKDWRSSFDAGYYALQLDYFRTVFGSVLLFYFPGAVLRLGTMVVLGVEACGWLLFLSPVASEPLRLMGVILFVFMHVSFAMSLNIGMFAYMTCASVLALLPGLFWRLLHRALRPPSPSRGMKCYYASGLHRMRALVFVFQDIAFIPSCSFEATDPSSSVNGPEEQNRLTVVDRSGETHHSTAAILVLMQSSRLLRCCAPLFSTSLGKRALRALVSWCGERTAQAFPLEGSRLPLSCSRITQSRSFSIARALFLLWCLVWILLWCVAYRNDFESFYPPQYELGCMLRLDQVWSMFSPSPPHADSYIQVIGKLKDGREVDLYRNGGLFSWHGEPITADPRVPASLPDRKPATHKRDVGNHRWAKYLEMTRSHSKKTQLRASLAKYICYHWNLVHESRRNRLLMLVMYDTVQESLPWTGGKGDPMPVIVYFQMCFTPHDLNVSQAWATWGYHFKTISGTPLAT